jgi:predicted RNA-binding protein Jag
VARVEFQGRDLSEAIAQAAEALDLPPETLKFQVLAMGAKGFLGLGRRKARIAVDPDDPTLDMDDDSPYRPDSAEQQVKPPPSSEAGTEKGPGPSALASRPSNR